MDATTHNPTPDPTAVRAAPAERWVARILPGEEAALVPAPRGPFGRAVVRALLRETVPDAREGVAFRVPLDRVTTLVGFCEDDGLLRALPINFLRWGPDGDPVPGPVVITREDPDGALYALRPGDLERLALVPGDPGGPRVLAVRMAGGASAEDASRAAPASGGPASGRPASAGPTPSAVA